MYFNKTHSKKDIIRTFEKLSVYPDKRLNKREIIESFDEIIKTAVYTKEIKNLTELVEFFHNPSPNKRLPIDKRNGIMMKCKKIIKHAKNNYCLESVGYLSHDEVFADCMDIHQYGSIPSVRRACAMFNKSPYQNERKVQPVIPADIQEELNQKKKIKKTYTHGVSCKWGEFIIEFD